MRIIHCLFTPSMGGLEQAFVDLTEALAGKGHEVICVIREDAPYGERLKPYAAVHTMRPPRGFYDIKAVLRLRKLLTLLKPDILLGHAPRGIRLLDWARIGMRVPLCGVLHSYKLSLIKRIRGADQVVVLTELMRETVIGLGFPAEKLLVVPNSIKLGEKPAFKPRGDILRVGMLGRLMPEKDIPTLLEASSALNMRGVEHRLLIAGDGKNSEHKLELQHQARRQGITVEWLGWITDKKAFFDSIDVFCLSSVEESFGLVIAEAMIHGVPVVVSDAPGPKTLVTNDVNGIVVGRGDVAGFADALERMWKDEALARRCVEAGWERVQEFDFARIANVWDALLKKLTSVR